jgi:GntR family transcriptional regulator
MTKLPSEQELAERIDVSRNTVREAIKALESEGYVIARHGIGTFVIRGKDNIRTNIANLDSSTKIIACHGYKPGTQSVSTAIIPAVGRPAREMKLTQKDQLFYLERVRTADGKPVVYVEDYLPYTEGMEKSTWTNITNLCLTFSLFSAKPSLSPSATSAPSSRARL